MLMHLVFYWREEQVTSDPRKGVVKENQVCTRQQRRARMIDPARQYVRYSSGERSGSRAIQERMLARRIEYVRAGE
jgi:hypothetical protein